jgi:hypothetical protein
MTPIACTPRPSAEPVPTAKRKITPVAMSAMHVPVPVIRRPVAALIMAQPAA